MPAIERIKAKDFNAKYPTFFKKPKAGTIDLDFKGFWKNPKQALAMFPVFSTVQDSWLTHTIPVVEFKKLK